MKLYEQRPKLVSNWLHEALLRIHEDLLTIHASVDQWAGLYPDTLTSLEKMVLVLEDRRFMTHAGIDLPSVARELSKAILFRRHGGASTIDMQFVRTITGYRDRKIARKLYEMLLTVLIQYRY